MITCMNRVEYLNQILPLKTFLISQKDSKKRCENTKKKKEIWGKRFKVN